MSHPEPARLYDLCDRAYRAGLYTQAGRLAREGAELATARGDHYWRVQFRFWEGASLLESGDREGATAALLEAARTEPEADPADVYNAITKLIEIAIADRPAAFTHRLIAQGRAHLEHCGKTDWRHMLDWLEGELARARGDWDAALLHHHAGHEARRRHRGYPGYTPAMHLIRLAELAFHQGDAGALNQWRRTLDDSPKEIEADRLGAERVRLLCHRAGLPGLGDPRIAARGLLRRVSGFEGDRAELARDALRVLLRHRDWPPVEDWLTRVEIAGDWLLMGDYHLARAWEVLGLPPRDPDWGNDAAPVGAALLTPARGHLDAARTHYQSMFDWAADQDQRLGTHWHTDTLHSRIRLTLDPGL